jgi:hypothetical protein
MRRRQRKFIGVVVTLAFVVVYALMAMALAQARFVQGAPDLVQWLLYATLGMGWILPLMPLIKWMERPDHGMTHEGWFDPS